jgi:hypothetical protein
VVLFSVCSSNQFGCAKALDSNSRGTVTVRQIGAWIGRYKVAFYDENDSLISSSSKQLSAGFSKDFIIPENACRVDIQVDALRLSGWKNRGCALFSVNLGCVSSDDKIEFIGKGASLSEYSMYSNTKGWRLGQ